MKDAILLGALVGCSVNAWWTALVILAAFDIATHLVKLMWREVRG